jgi:hypothetical protein
VFFCTAKNVVESWRTVAVSFKVACSRVVVSPSLLLLPSPLLLQEMNSNFRDSERKLRDRSTHFFSEKPFF